MEANKVIGKVQTEEISFWDIVFKIRDWYKFLLSKWIVILCLGLIGGLVGLVYSYYKKPIFIADTTFVLEEEKAGAGGGLSSLAGLASMAGVDLGGGGGGIFQGDNILELYKSRTMIEKTLLTQIEYKNKRQPLIEFYIEFNKLRQKWAKKPELNKVTFDNKVLKVNDRTRDSIIGVVVKDINENYLKVAKVDKKLSIIKAEVRSTNEFFAKTFNQQIVKNVNDFYVQTKVKKSLENVRILQQKTDSVRKVMNGAIYEAAATNDATPNLNPVRQIQRVAPVQRSQFSAETNKAILSVLVQNLEMSKVAMRKDEPLIQVVDQPVFPLERERLGKLKGLVIGGSLFGFLTIIFLILRKIIRDIEFPKP